MLSVYHIQKPFLPLNRLLQLVRSHLVEVLAVEGREVLIGFVELSCLHLLFIGLEIEMRRL